MSELEQQLRELGGDVFPPEPDMRLFVRDQLVAPPRTRRARPPRRAVLAFAVLLVAGLLAVLAIPEARSAFQRWLHLGSARVAQVETLPSGPRGLPAIGDPVSQGEAERVLGHELLLPELLGRPERLLLDTWRSLVVLTWTEPYEARLMEIDGPYFQKLLPRDLEVERVEINGQPGFWIDDEHSIELAFDQPRLTGPVLLWTTGTLTLRLDGRLSREEALRIARSAHS
jgi:hypothetical protein